METLRRKKRVPRGTLASQASEQFQIQEIYRGYQIWYEPYSGALSFQLSIGQTQYSKKVFL